MGKAKELQQEITHEIENKMKKAQSILRIGCAFSFARIVLGMNTLHCKQDFSGENETPSRVKESQGLLVV